MERGISRVCLLISDLQTQDTLVINEPGPIMQPSDWQGFAAFVQEQAHTASAVSFSGSLMPNVPIAAYTDLVQALVHTQKTVYIDISGEPLRATLDLPIALLKVNAHELGAALGHTISSPAEALAAAQAVRSRKPGPQAVVVTLGAAGAIACNHSGAWHAQTPPIQLVSPVGSGDAVLAGITTQLLHGASMDSALLTGVACGAANAQTLGGGIIEPAEVQRLVAAGSVEALEPGTLWV
jgi:1-phosphofructokinase family hexose kinase